MTNKAFNLESNSELEELNLHELENIDGGVVAIGIGAALAYFGGGVVVGAAIGYGVV